MSDLIVRDNNIVFWQNSIFQGIHGLMHGFSSRIGGVSQGQFAELNLGYKGGDKPEKVDKNRKKFYQTMGFNCSQVFILKQVHGCTVHEVTSDGKSAMIKQEGDALVTSETGVALGIMAADCAAIFFFDPDNQAIGLAHAGWRGTAEGISLEVLKKMESLYATNVNRVKVAISPAIDGCCYQVKEDLLQLLNDKKMLSDEVWTKRDSFYYLYLKEINRYQILKAGVNPANIFISGYCTSCSQKLFYSYRRDGRKTGSMMALLGLQRHSSVSSDDIK